MRTPSKNIFNIDPIRLEYAIDKFAGKRHRTGVFYPSVSSKVNLVNYKSDILLIFPDKAINPLELAEESEFYFAYEGERILRFIILSLLLLI